MASTEEKVITDDVIMWGAIGLVAYVGIIKPILNEVGVNPADAATVNDIQNTDPYENPFSYQYQPFLDLYGDNGTIDQFLINEFTTAKEGFSSFDQSQFGSPLYQLYAAAEQIYNSFGLLTGVFTSAYPDISAAIKSLADKISVAWVSAYLYYTYGVDLFTLMQKGKHSFLTFNDGITTGELATIVSYVNNLP